MEGQLKPWQNAVSGGLAGVSCRLVVAPFDVIKIRLQLQSQGQSRSKYRTMLQSAALIVREEGVSGLWKGNLPALFLYLCYSGVQFLSYYELNSIDMLQRNLDPGTRSFVCGSVAGLLATASSYPLDLLRTRFAAQGTEKIYASLMDSVCTIYAREGVSGFYRGVVPAALQVVPYTGTVFSAHAYFKKRLQQLWTPQKHALVETSQYEKYCDLLAGAAAGAVSKTLVMPLDVVRFQAKPLVLIFGRKRMQVQGPSRDRYVVSRIPVIPEGSSILSTGWRIFSTEGLAGLYRGLVPSIFKAAPSSAVTFLVVGVCRSHFSKSNNMKKPQEHPCS